MPLVDGAVVYCPILLVPSYKLTFRLVGEEALVVCLLLFAGEVLLRDIFFVGHFELSVFRIFTFNSLLYLGEFFIVT